MSWLRGLRSWAVTNSNCEFNFEGKSGCSIKPLYSPLLFSLQGNTYLFYVCQGVFPHTYEGEKEQHSASPFWKVALHAKNKLAPHKLD